jgi:hypothetical protein
MQHNNLAEHHCKASMTQKLVELCLSGADDATSMHWVQYLQCDTQAVNVTSIHSSTSSWLSPSSSYSYCNLHASMRKEVVNGMAEREHTCSSWQTESRLSCNPQHTAV